MTDFIIPEIIYKESTIKQQLEDAGFRDYTQEFYKFLHIDEEEVWKGATINRIKTKPIIILGTTNIGKTTLAENIINDIEKKYSHKGVCPVYTNEVSLGELIEHGLQTFRHFGEQWKGGLPSIYVLVFDDATAVEVTPEEVRDFFSIRHKTQEYTGITEGIIYSVFLTHDWYSLNKFFRRYGEVAIFLSVPPLDKFSRENIEKLIGKKAVTILNQLSHKAMDYDAFKGYGFVKLPYSPEGENQDVGYIHFEKTHSTYVKIKSWQKQVIDVNLVNMVLNVPKAVDNNEIKRELKILEQHRKNNREAQRRFRERKKESARET